MPITLKEIDAKLKKAIGFKDKDRKVAYIMSLSQWIAADYQMEQVEKGLALAQPEKTSPP
ncbi:hypothetical protein ES703_02137 [subsurface metagenome]